MELLVLKRYRVIFKKMKMKKFIYKIQFKLTIIFLLTNIIFVMKSQIVVDMTSDEVLPFNYNETGQYYEKDIHNYLDNFTGTWEYVNGNEKFQIILTKIVKYHFVDSDLKLNFYEDGIVLRYKKFTNGNLVFESPIKNKPTFSASDNTKLEGYMVDYGRVTVDAEWPLNNILNMGVLRQGGEYFHPSCTIERLPLNLSEPPKIKFSLSLRQSIGGEYKNPAYNGLPTFSIPNNIIMTKVP